MRQRRTRRFGFGAASVALAATMASAQTFSPTTLFEGTTTTPGKTGAPQSVHVSVQAWRIAGQEQELPLRGFYLAHLLSGQISTTIDGRTSEHLPGDFWTVAVGASMRVKVVGEVAALETIVVAKE
jgi:hypothetical protein